MGYKGRNDMLKGYGNDLCNTIFPGYQLARITFAIIRTRDDKIL